MSTPAERGMAAGWNFKLVMEDVVVEADFLTDNLKTMKSRSVRDDDIFLCTYPKTGTHWTWEILNMIVAGKAEYAKHWQNSACLEFRTEEELEELVSPRIFHTHLRPSHVGISGNTIADLAAKAALNKSMTPLLIPYSDYKAAITSYIRDLMQTKWDTQMPKLLWKRGCKVVYVERNAKDCAVSSYCQVSQQVWKEDPRQEITFIGSWDDFLTAYGDGCVPFGSIFDHVNDWKNISAVHGEFEICIVQYEDMKQDCVAEIRRMAEYLDRPLPEERYRDIAEACSFKNLKEASEKIKDQTYHVPWEEGTSGYFRKGISGDWKNSFTVAQSEEFDRKQELKMKQK